MQYASRYLKALTLFVVIGFLGSALAQSVEVVFPGTSEAERAWAERALQAVRETYPDIDVRMSYIGWGDLTERLVPRITAGNPPDLVMQQDFANFHAMGALEPLTAYLEEQPMNTVERDVFVESLLDFSTLDGDVYTLPVVGIGYGLIVRTDLLAEAGYTVEDLTTWESFLEIAEALTIDRSGDGRIDQYGFVYPTGHPRFAWRQAYIMGYSNNMSLLDFDQEEKYLRLLDFIKDLTEFVPAGAQAMDLAEAFNAITFGRAAMMATGSFYGSNVYSLDPDVVNVSSATAFPRGPDVDAGWVPVANAGWAMFAGSGNKDAAWQVMTLLSSQELGGEYSSFINVPARVDVTDDQIAVVADALYPEAPEANRRIVGEFFDAVDRYGVPMEQIPGREEMERVFTREINALIDGSKSSEQVFAALREEITAIQTAQR